MLEPMDAANDVAESFKSGLGLQAGDDVSTVT